MVEAQHQVSTRKLVDSDAEQQLLEELIDRVKPPVRTRQLHYLLFTPFRYPPLRYGSRFGSRSERGIWYGAEQLRVAFAEVAYYRLLFLEGTQAGLGLVQTELTAFRARIETPRGVDLTSKSFAACAEVLLHPADYRETQALGTAMREAGVAAFRFASARDEEHGPAIGVFRPEAFGRRLPKDFQTWHCTATKELVELVKRDFLARESYGFPRSQFLVDGRLPRI